MAMEFDDKGNPEIRKQLHVLGVGNDLSIERRVQIIQQRLAELLTALEQARIKTQ